MKIYIVILSFIVIAACSIENSNRKNTVTNPKELGLIPEPQHLQLSDQLFELNKETSLLVSENNLCNNSTDYLINYMSETLSITPVVSNDTTQDQDVIVYKVACAIDSVQDEGYTLKVGAKEIEIKAVDDKGFFYATQTLIQLLPLWSNKLDRYDIPGVIIRDNPEFSYRGMHLDVCRHFFKVDFIKKLIDQLARHKMNVFHWHLTEDQGWRIQIEKYPGLTETASKRKETVVDKNFVPYVGDKTPYEGFYTKGEVREIVEYAKQRFITVIPEIELPGHSLAALSAYPELSCTGGPFEVGTKWGIYKDVYCAGNDSVFIFLENVLDEVCELFPSEYIHIGGDECLKTRWKECEKCQARIADEGLVDEHQLQSYFIKRIEKYLNSKGRKIIGWDEILEGGLAPDATVMSWRGVKGGVEAANKEHYVIMTPGRPCYFDHYQSDSIEAEPLAIGGYNPIDSVFAYNPVPEDLPADKRKFILGAQANVWTEYMNTNDHVEYMVFPRICALAEAVWSCKPNRSFDDFKERLSVHSKRLDRAGISYRKKSL